MQQAFNKNAAPHSFTEAGGENFAYPQQSPAPEKFSEGEKADVVIIGGGYTGLSAALHLAQMARERGEKLDIVLLEAGKIGSAASGKSGGHVTPGFQEHDEKTVLKMFPTAEDGEKALKIISEGPGLVEKIIRENNIDADMRPGYIYISGGKQQLVQDKDYFGIEPYPFVLGMAEAARKLGVKIYENTPVTDIFEKDGLEVKTSRGSIFAIDVVAAGGHKMAEVVPYLKPLRNRTLELQATTIVTDPLPPEVIKSIMPVAGGAHIAFSTDAVDVAYGTVDRQGRIIFGANVGALRANPASIAKKLFGIFPALKDNFKEATGKDIAYKPLVSNEPLNLTADLLPNIGRMGKDGHVRYIHALGGHGIALGTALGRTVAKDIFGSRTGDAEMQQEFTLLSSPKHLWTPGWKPLRLAIAFTASAAVKTLDKLSTTLKKIRARVSHRALN